MFAACYYSYDVGLSEAHPQAQIVTNQRELGWQLCHHRNEEVVLGLLLICGMMSADQMFINANVGY